MAKIQNLLKKLSEVADVELLQFSGSEPRQFFIELTGVNNVDTLLKGFTPSNHNSEWDKERQKESPEPQSVIQPRQSIAFMSSGKNGVYRRYKETELTAYVHGVAHMIRNSYFLGLTEELTDKNMKLHE